METYLIIMQGPNLSILGVGCNLIYLFNKQGVLYLLVLGWYNFLSSKQDERRWTHSRWVWAGKFLSSWTFQLPSKKWGAYMYTLINSFFSINFELYILSVFHKKCWRIMKCVRREKKNEKIVKRAGMYLVWRVEKLKNS